MVKPGDVFSKDKVTRHTFAKRELPESHEQSFLFETYDDWLDSRLERNQGAFVVYGLSKTGKTSMVEQSFHRVRKNPVTLQGKDITSIDSFWGSIADQLKVPSEWENGSKLGLSESVNGSFGCGVANASAAMGSQEETQSTETRRARSNFEVSKALVDSGRPLFVDDFHHCSGEVVNWISRELKPLVRDTLVVLVAIPAESFSPIRGTADNAGRFEPVEIRLWSQDELSKIGTKGFQALGFQGSAASLAKVAAKEAYGSPQIMQELCLVMAQLLAKVECSDESAVMRVQERLTEILRSVASQIKPQNMTQFIQGKPRKGKKRKQYSFSRIPDYPDFDDTKKFDYYGVTLIALRELVKSYQVRCDVSTLSEYVRLLGCDPAIDSNRLGRPVSYLVQIANETRGILDPSLVMVGGGFEGAKAEIEIVDPYLAYYLANGSWISDAVV